MKNDALKEKASDSPAEVSKTLTDAERKRLLVFEKIIETHQKNFIAIGEALVGISSEKLYKETHSSFDPYCDETLGFSGSHARRLMDAFTVVNKLRQASVKEADLPKNEYQARMLFEKRAENKWVGAWNKILKAAKKNGGKITASLIEENLKSTAQKAVEAKVTKKGHTSNGGVDQALKLIEQAKETIEQKALADWRKFLEALEKALKQT